MRVLIVEDDPILRIDIADSLADLGHEVIGPFGSVDEALRACETAAPEAAILDFNLGPGRDSREVAAMLRERGVRFAFLTGHGRSHLPAEFAGVPLIEKPYHPSDLERFLQAARAA